LKSTLPGDTWRTLLQTFRTKIFLSLSDDFSGKIASELCGQEEKWRVNYNISESGHDSRVSYLTGKPLADKAHISTSETYSQQRDYVNVLRAKSRPILTRDRELNAPNGW
jgi:hypothetical protein